MEPLIRILVVEDNELAQMMLKALLAKCDCTTDIVSTGEDAVRKANEHSYDLILMDIGLGNTDGFTVTSTIKKYSPLNQTTPVIAVTAHQSEEYTQRAREVGMVDYVIKPLMRDTFSTLIHKYLMKDVQ